MCHIIGINVISKPTSLKNCFKTSNLVQFIRKGTDLFNINLVGLSSCRLHTYGPQFYYSPAPLSLVDEAFYIKCLPLSTCSLSVNTFLLSLFTLKGKEMLQSYGYEENPQVWSNCFILGSGNNAESCHHFEQV